MDMKFFMELKLCKHIPIIQRPKEYLEVFFKCCDTCKLLVFRGTFIAIYSSDSFSLTPLL